MTQAPRRDWTPRIAYGPLVAAAPLAVAGASMAFPATFAAAAPVIGTVAPAVAAGLSILGTSQQSQAQRDAGNVAYQNALLRRKAAYTQAAQEDVNAGQELAAGQRTQIQALTRGQVLASRLKAVMGASGAGYDPNLVADIEGQGKYAADVAGYNAAERARTLTNDARMTRYSGDVGAYFGQQDDAAANRRADATLVGGYGNAALSFAGKYGGTPPGSKTSTPVGDNLNPLDPKTFPSTSSIDYQVSQLS